MNHRYIDHVLILLVATTLMACVRGKPGDSSAPRETGPDSADDTAGVDVPGVVRLGPPSPSVGAYGIATPVGGDEVYVSNLHVPFITIADSTTGAWTDSIDLRDGCAERPFFPQLFLAGDVLWVTDIRDTRMCRFDTSSDTWLPYVDVPDMVEAVTVTDDGVWVADDTGLSRYDGADVVERVPLDDRASSVAVDGDDIAFIALGTVTLLDRTGAVRWRLDASDDTLRDIALFDGRVFVTERETGDVIAIEDGVEVGRVHTGSDTFAIKRIDDTLYVTNRQGAALPPSGAYEGAGGVVTALTRDLDVLWTTTLSKTIHFLAFDGQYLWTANEDALRLSKVDPADGTEVLRGEPIGLTLDHVDAYNGDLYFGSHLTDELWRTDATGERTASTTVCGWPFVAVPFEAALAVPCQESGDIWTVDPESMDVLSETHAADTFFPPCGDGLCTAHDVLIAAAVDGSTLVYTDAYDSSVHWTSGADPVVLDGYPERVGVQHFDVISAATLGGTGVITFEPRAQTLYRIDGGAVVASRSIPERSADFPLVLDDDRVWVGETAFDGNLAEVARLPAGAIASTAGEGWIVAVEGSDLVVYARDTLDESGRLVIEELRAPPYVQASGDPGPLRFRVVDDQLVLANTMRGTVERRALPSLLPVGTDEVVAVGRWAELPGLR